MTYVPECGGYIDSIGTHHDCVARVQNVQVCRTCMDAQIAANQRKRIRGEREVARRAAQGYGPAPEGTDPFRGFR